MLESPAYRVLIVAAHRVISRIEVELGHHRGNDNGKLPVTYDDFIEYGVARILGFIRVKHGRGGNAESKDAKSVRALRALLKSLLHRHGFRCLSIEESMTRDSFITPHPQPRKENAMRRFSIFATEFPSDRHEVEVCQVDASPDRIAAVLRKKRTATNRKRFWHVRIVDRLLTQERNLLHG
jgi:hypothetical protein